MRSIHRNVLGTSAGDQGLFSPSRCKGRRAPEDSSDGRAKELCGARNRRPRIKGREEFQRGKSLACRRQIEHPRTLRGVTLAAQRATAVVILRRVVVRGFATLVDRQIVRRMARTMPGFHTAHRALRQDRGRMRRLPRRTDGELQDEQRSNHPIGGPVTHDFKRVHPPPRREKRVAHLWEGETAARTWKVSAPMWKVTAHVTALSAAANASRTGRLASAAPAIHRSRNASAAGRRGSARSGKGPVRAA